MRLSWSPTLKVVYNFRMGFPKNYCSFDFQPKFRNFLLNGKHAPHMVSPPRCLNGYRWTWCQGCQGLVFISFPPPRPPNPSTCLFELRWGWEFACLRSRSKPRAFAVWMKFTFYDNWSSRAVHWLICIVNKRTDTWIYILGDASTNASG